MSRPDVRSAAFGREGVPPKPREQKGTSLIILSQLAPISDVPFSNPLGGRFVERIIFDGRLGGHEAVVGGVDADGDLDICFKAWGPLPWNANRGKMHADYLENLLIKKQKPKGS